MVEDKFSGALAKENNNNNKKKNKKAQKRETEAAKYKLYCLIAWPFLGLWNEVGKGFAGPRLN